MELSPLNSTQGLWPAHDLSLFKSVDGEKVNQLEQVAKDFESVLLQKILEQMSQTVGEWGFEKDGASKQVQGMFWSLMAQTLADNGGLGLWREIEKSMTAHSTDPIAAEGVNRAL